MKLIDVHVHMFPEDIAETYLKHYTEKSGQSLLCTNHSIVGLKEAYKAHEVLKYVVLGQWESSIKLPSENVKLMAESDIYYERHYFFSYHQWLAKLQRENDDIVCFGNVHPDDPEMMAELEAMFTQHDLIGLKLIPCMQFYHLNDKRFFPAFEKAEAENKPLTLHTGGDPTPGREIYAHPREVDEIASAFPNLKINMAHMGAPFFDETKAILSKHENVFTDISFTIDYNEVMKLAKRQGMIDVSNLSKSDFNSTISALIKDFGIEKIMYGSDFPYARPEDAINGLMALDLDDDAKEQILWKNAEAFLSI